jgi:hypothetical protein
MNGFIGRSLMSRIIVITLLAFNLLLVGVQVLGHSPGAPSPTNQPSPSLRQSPPTPVPARSDSDLPRIVLVGEQEEIALSSNSGFQCYTLGPFETESSLRRVQQALEGVMAQSHERHTEALMELGFWVALQPYDSFAGAGDAMQALQRQGMEDVAVVNNEPGVFHVSLGYFLDERNARKRRDDVRLLGFEAETRLQRETQSRWWLDYAKVPGARDASSVLRDEDIAGLNRGIPCPAELAGL